MTRLITFTLILSLTSCKLAQVPFRVVGGVTRGTARAVKKPIDAHKQRKAKKEKEKAKEKAKKKREEAQKQSSSHLPPGFLPPPNDGTPELPPLPSEYQDLPPLPSEYQDPLPLPQ